MKVRNNYLILSFIIIFIISLVLTIKFKNIQFKEKEIYSCMNLNGKIKVEYIENKDKIKLIDNRGKTKILKSILSGSGEKYEGENNIFHTNGKDAVFGINGVEYTCSKI